jgi:glycerol-3-phosphate acyltransferase PlsY
MRWIIPGIVISYLIGSIPFAYIFGRAMKGIDIRKFGSGNVGATNVLRVLGKGPALAVLALDTLKGLACVIFVADGLAARVSVDAQTLRLVFGISAILGHNWTIFLKFKGGKGVATTIGVLMGLAIKVTSLRLIFGLLVLTWLAIFLFARIVSLASVLTGIMFPVYAFIFKQNAPLILAALLIALFIILRHKANLQRLLQGKEPRIRFKS